MNKVTLIGRTTKEIKLEKYGKGNGAGVYAKVTLAIRAAKDKTGFIYCTLWGKTAEIAAEYVNKGDLVAFGGRLASSQFEDENGKTVFRTDVSINEIELLTSKRDAKEDDEDDWNEDEDEDEDEDEKPAKKAKKANRRSK